MPPRKGTTRKPKEKVNLDYSIDSLVGEKFEPSRKINSITISKDNIRTFLKNPQQNYEKLQQISTLLRTTNGVYDNIVRYYVNMLHFDHMIIPTVNTSMFEEKKVTDSYMDTAKYVNNLRVKENLRMFYNDIITNGEGYYLKIEDNNGTIFKPIRNSFCQVYSNVNGVLRFALDMTKLKDEDPFQYPELIQKLIKLFKSNPDSSLFINKKWYPLEEDGVAFIIGNKDGNHGIPYFSGVFTDLINLEEKKELSNSIDLVNNSILLANQIPLSSKDSQPILTPQEGQKYQQALKMNLKAQGLERVFSLTSPLDVEAVKLNLDSSATKSMVKEAVNNIFDSVGTSANVFNSDSSATALTNGVRVDASFVREFIGMFENYFNSLLLKKKSKGIAWQLKILENDIFSSENERKTASAEMAYGGSVFNFLALTHMTPLQAINVLSMEKSMGVKTNGLLSPIQTSHTQSNTGDSSVDSESGRPSASDMMDSGEVISDSTETNLENDK